jgi:hypothetical protein
MTSEDVKSELHKQPFIPFRLHLVSGQTVDVRMVRQAELLQNTIMVFQEKPQPDGEILYDVISLRNIERIEQIGSSHAAPRSDME